MNTEAGRNARPASPESAPLPLLLAPSLMCADLMNLASVLRELEQNKVDFLHVDLMDGEFVPNFAFGVDFIQQLAAATSLPLDIHMMVTRPEEKIPWLPLRPGDCVTVHAEAALHLQRALAAIHARQALAGVALNPATPLCMTEEIWDEADVILVMTVNPGFAGQKMVPSALRKIARLRRMLDKAGKQNVWIEVDGNVSFQNGKLMVDAGANMLVGGSSSMFSRETTLADSIARMRSWRVNNES